MHFRRKNLKVRTRYIILNFLHFFLASLGMSFCPPGSYCSTASSEKSAGKFKMLYQVLTLRLFSPEIHALVFTSWKHAEWDNLAIFNPLWSSPTPKQTNESATANEKAWCTLYNSYTNLQITFFSRQKNFISGTKEKDLFKGFWLAFYYLKKESILAIQKILSPLQLGQFSPYGTTAPVVSVSFSPLWNMLCSPIIF